MNLVPPKQFLSLLPSGLRDGRAVWGQGGTGTALSVLQDLTTETGVKEEAPSGVWTNFTRQINFTSSPEVISGGKFVFIDLSNTVVGAWQMVWNLEIAKFRFNLMYISAV